MSVRKKTRLERWLSFNQHRKRFGAAKAMAALQPVGTTGMSLDDLKAQTIDGEQPVYTHGADKDIARHIENLRGEFAGQSALLHYHASLIVMIRREYRTRQNIAGFEQLWEQETSYLLEHLNTRWLVSAADTFVDCAQTPLVRALAMNASVLVNTVKMQETERFLQQAETISDDPERQRRLTSGRVDLFDGTAAFAVGTDDTLRNMRWRIDEMADLHPVGRILAEVFQRMQNEDTVFRRFKDRHTRKKTAWW